MPRINIDDLFFSDKRIYALAEYLGEHIYTTQGRLLNFWHYCFSQKVSVLTQSEITIQSGKNCADALVEFGLAELLDNAMYRIKGIDDRIQWLLQRSKAGLKSAKIRKAKYGSSKPGFVNDSRTTIEHPFTKPRTTTEPLTLSLSPSLTIIKSKSAASDKIASRPAKIIFSEKGFENITPERKVLWEKSYPTIHIETELLKAESWMRAHPERVKQNHERFIVNWLSRANPSQAQNSYHPNQQKIPYHLRSFGDQKEIIQHNESEPNE